MDTRCGEIDQMTKRKVLVIVGAGASVEFGMPSVSDVGELLTSAANQWFPLADDPSRNAYEWLATTVKAYWATTTKPALAREPNFEHLLHAIFILSSAYPNGLLTSPLGGLVTPISMPDVLSFGKNRQKIGKDVLRALASLCADTIIDAFRGNCRQLNTTAAAMLQEMSGFLAALSSEFDIAVVTLNYDDIIWQTLPGLDTGFGADGIFDEKLLLLRSGWACILHLHGSVHFDMKIRKLVGLLSG